MQLDLSTFQPSPSLKGEAADMLERARHVLLDTIGATIAGRDAPATRQTRALFPRGRRHSSTETSLLLGVAAQALDLDETNLRARCHLGASIVPALASVAAERAVSGATVLNVLIDAYEFAARLGEAVAPGHGSRGWHPSSTIGAFGACFAASRLLELNEDEARHALGIAGTQAAGVKAVFGGTAKAFNLGRAAQAGVTAAKLAAAGMTAPHDPFTSETSFFASAGASPFGRSADRHPLLDNHFKFLPFCIETHAAALAAARLKAGSGRFERVRVVLAPTARAMVDRPQPLDMDQARFSVQYLVARSLREPALSPAPEPFDAGLLARAPAITIQEDPALGHLAARIVGCIHDRELEEQSDLGPSGAFDADALQGKFDMLAGSFLPEGARRMRKQILAMDREADAGRIMRALIECVCRDPPRP
jgi:2-methylcitrate dehydratase PrpD